MSTRIQPMVQSLFALLLVLSSFVNPLTAQERISIKGTVTDKTTGEALEHVNIAVQNTKSGAVSDKEGRFVIENLPEGEYALTFSMLGYKERRVESIRVEPGKTVVLEMALQPTVLDILQELVVIGTRSIHSLKDVPIETNLIPAREIKNIGLQTLTNAISWVPGINTSGGAPNGAARRFTGLIHGLPAQYSMILIDGQRAKSEHIHTGINMNLVPISMIERIEVVKGPASALYGSEAFGGVINIISTPLPEKPVYGAEVSYGSYNTRNINLNHGASVDRFGYYINGNLIRTDGVPDANDIRFDYRQVNLLGKLAFKPTAHNTLKLNTRYYNNRYLRNLTLPKVEDHWIDASGRWETRFNNRSGIKTGLSYSHFKGEYRDDDNRTIMADAVYTNEFNHNTVTTGFEIRNERYSRNATPQKGTTIPGVFIQDEARLAPSLTIVTALRLDHHPNVGTEFTPKFSVLYRLTPDTDIRASAGKGFRAPSLQDLF